MLPRSPAPGARRHRSLLSRIAFFVTLLALAQPAAATVLLPADFRDIVSGSQIIVHGRVVDVRAEWVDGRSRIDSLVTVAPQAFFRGTPAETVTFRVPGGRVGRYKSVTIGAPEFQPGDEAVFFLRANGPAVPQVFGLSQGVFRVRTDGRTGKRAVILPVMMSGSEHPERVVRGTRARQPLDLEAFGAEVRAVLRERGAR